MPRGLPDYLTPENLIAARILDLSDMMAALRGITTCDGRGRIVFIDTFGDGLSGFYINKSGDGALPVLDTAKSCVPPCSAYLDCGTLAGSGSSYFYRSWQEYEQADFGVEARIFMLTDAGLVGTLFISGFYYDATHDYNWSVAWDVDTGELKVWTTTGYVTVATIGISAYAPVWPTVKVVIDTTNQTYRRLIFGQHAVDVEGIPVKSSAVPGAPRMMSVTVGGLGQGTTAFGLWVGAFILTFDEP